MIFTELRVAGAWAVEVQQREDERGFFARVFCREEFQAHGLPGDFVQCSASFNLRRGTLRGMHFQKAPSREGKLVRCTSGVILDVIIDLHPDSATYCAWEAMELTAENRRALYIPPGFAHGFQALTDNAEVFYQMTDFYAPDLAGGVRWNDPAFGIDWPIQPPILSDRDAAYPDFSP